MGLLPSPLLSKSQDFPIGLYVQTASELQFIRCLWLVVLSEYAHSYESQPVGSPI